MGMFSEIHAMGEAKELDKVLMVAIEKGDITILSFCKEYIYPLYNNVCSNTYSSVPSDNYEKITEFFKKF
jgi:hypothetical protein